MRRSLLLLLAVPLAATAARAQVQPATPFATAAPTDSPWGDFPLGRLQRGARVMLTSPDGGRTEGRVMAVGDSTLQLESTMGEPQRALTLAELRGLRRVEVRAFPVASVRARAATIGLVAGAAAGALLGVARPRSGVPSALDRGRDGTRGALLGACAGWWIGNVHFGGARWREVTLPR